MTHVLRPQGPFLLILWDPLLRHIEVKGSLDDKAMAFELIERGRQCLVDHYRKLAEDEASNLVRRPPVIQLTDA